MKHDRITLEYRDNVALLTLNDPSVLNAFGTYLRADMTEALDAVEAGPARCLVITGAGRAFSSGANLNDPNAKARDRAAELRGETKSSLETWYNPFFVRLRHFEIPIVTAINGIAAGVGMSLALSGDMRIAAKSASFLQAFARIGLVPDGGSSWVLPRLIGMARAMELMLMAELLPAETALEWGLINRCVDDAELMPVAMDIAQRLANGPRSLGMIRRMTWDSLENTYQQQLSRESQLQMQAGMTSDHTEGVTAFREKRAAKFTGR